MKKLFNYIISDEPQLEDDMYELKTDNNIYIQVSIDGVYLVHKYYEDSFEGCSEFLGEYKSLKDAMKKALEIRYNDLYKTKGEVSTLIFREYNEISTLLGRMYNISK
tara:strand:- start:428 stop:748 length:321 start_codon:yes stop_codon:yes gene_type:complete